MPERFEILGWIARSMDEYRHDRYGEMFGRPMVRVPPKIYRTEKVAARYGTPQPVYIKVDEDG